MCNFTIFNHLNEWAYSAPPPCIRALIIQTSRWQPFLGVVIVEQLINLELEVSVQEVEGVDVPALGLQQVHLIENVLYVREVLTQFIK